MCNVRGYMICRIPKRVIGGYYLSSDDLEGIKEMYPTL
jgi:hypothetical protein